MTRGHDGRVHTAARDTALTPSIPSQTASSSTPCDSALGVVRVPVPSVNASISAHSPPSGRGLSFCVTLCQFPRAGSDAATIYLSASTAAHMF